MQEEEDIYEEGPNFVFDDNQYSCDEPEFNHQDEEESQEDDDVESVYHNWDE